MMNLHDQQRRLVDLKPAFAYALTGAKSAKRPAASRVPQALRARDREGGPANAPYRR